MFRVAVLLGLLAVTFAQTCDPTQSCVASSDVFGARFPQHPLGFAGRAWRHNNQDRVGTTLPPLIIVPGLLGSGLEVKMDFIADIPLLCTKFPNWQRIWIEPLHVARLNCFADEMALNYDPVSNNFSNPKGVYIQPIDFGGVDGVNYLAWNAEGQPFTNSSYMQPLIANLESAGYVVGSNLATAPYDWRQCDDPSGWNQQLQTLIESMYAGNGNTPVYLMCHSMGNLEFSSFLTTMSQAWKDQYIAGFISAAGPWSGASLTLRALISGLNLEIGPISLSPDYVAQLTRTWGSMVWMFPDQQIMQNQPLVYVNDSVSYTSAQLGELLGVIGATEAQEVFANYEGSLANLLTPGVETYCLYGVNYPTETSYEYEDGLFAQPTCISCGDGDGVVPIKSLQRCAHMNPIATKTFNLVGHMDLVKDPLFFNYLMEIVTGKITSGSQ